MEFTQESYDTLVKLKKLLLEDETLDKMLKAEMGSDQWVLIALESALPLLEKQIETETE